MAALEKLWDASPRGFKSHSLRWSEPISTNPVETPNRLDHKGRLHKVRLPACRGAFGSAGRIDGSSAPRWGAIRRAADTNTSNKSSLAQRRQRRRRPPDWRRRLQEGRHQHSDQDTVEGLLNRWMEHIEGLGRAPTTLARYRSAISHDIVPRLGSFGSTDFSRRTSTATTARSRRRDRSP